MKQSYEENIADIIHAFHELKTISPSEVLAIMDVALNYNVNIPSYELFNLFTMIKEKYENVELVGISKVDGNREIWWLDMKDKKRKII